MVKIMRKKLTKSRDNVVLTGTLAGLAEYLNIDPTIVRIVYVFLALMGFGAPVLLYIGMAILIPADNSDRSKRYGNDNKYYKNNNYRSKGTTSRPRKEAEKVDEEDWSDF